MDFVEFKTTLEEEERKKQFTMEIFNEIEELERKLKSGELTDFEGIGKIKDLLFDVVALKSEDLSLGARAFYRISLIYKDLGISESVLLREFQKAKKLVCKNEVDVEFENSIFKSLEEICEANEEIEFLVDKILPKGGTLLICGETQSFKSWLAIKVGLSILKNEPFLSFKTNSSAGEGVVCYLDGEMGKKVLVKRIKRLTPLEEIKKNFFISDTVLHLENTRQREKLFEWLDLYLPTAIIVDPMISFIRGGGDENASTDIRSFWNVITEIRKRWDCSIVLVHHTRKQEGSEMNKVRGSTDIINYPDCVLFSKNQGGGEIELSCIKNRHINREKIPPLKLHFTENNGFLDFIVEKKLTPEEKREEKILNLLAKSPLSRSELEKRLAHNKNFRETLNKLIKKGKVKKRKEGRRCIYFLETSPPSVAIYIGTEGGEVNSPSEELNLERGKQLLLDIANVLRIWGKKHNRVPLEVLLNIYLQFGYSQDEVESAVKELGYKIASGRVII